jgi:hypothetical protein
MDELIGWKNEGREGGMDGWMDGGWVDELGIDGWMDKLMGGRMKGWMDGWVG